MTLSALSNRTCLEQTFALGSDAARCWTSSADLLEAACFKAQSCQLTPHLFEKFGNGELTPRLLNCSLETTRFNRKASLPLPSGPSAVELSLLRDISACLGQPPRAQPQIHKFTNPQILKSMNPSDLTGLASISVLLLRGDPHSDPFAP